MREDERGAGEQPRNISITPGSGSVAANGEGRGMRVQGPNREDIRVSDSDGSSAVDIQDGTMTRATTTGGPSKNEDGSLATGRILARRQNQDGATWGDGYEVKARIGGGVDCEAKDTDDPSRLLKIQITRAESDGAFWTRLGQEGLAELPPSTVDEVVARVWKAISKKRLHAHPDEVLALNAIRTPWAVSRPVIDTFRQRHGEAARRLGFKEVWVVGWSEAMTERLDT